jgi:DNA-binding IclR family transcriptional regulator
MTGTSAPANTIQSVDRALRLLAIVAASREPVSGVEVATRAGINRSTAWKLLATLEEHRLVDRDATNRYVVGIGAISLTTASPWTAAAHRARPLLLALSARTAETTVLSVVNGNGITGVSQVDGPNALGVRWVGDPLPLTSTSPGKLLLASLLAADLDAVLLVPVPARTARTCTDPAAIRAEIAAVRARGIATSIGDHELGVNGVSAPIHDRAGRLVAAVSVTGPDVRLGEARIDQIEPLVRDAAARLTEAFGIGANDREAGR